MWSKLIPRDSATQAKPIIYRTLADQRSSGVQIVKKEADQPASTDESQRLRARVAELEKALAGQVAAARQSGFREGEASGRSQGEASVKPLIERMARSVHEVLELKPRLRKELEEDAVQLSLAIAKRVLRRELNVDPAALQSLVQVAFERMGRSEASRVIVHPEHAAAVREALALLTSREIEIRADGSREKGTLVFETNRGALDASVDSQLREIEFGLAERLKWR